MTGLPGSPSGRPPESATRYLVELAIPVGGLTAVQTLAERARRGATWAMRNGVRVRFLRVVFVPEDGSCFLLYEGASELAVRSAVAGAGIDVATIADTLAAGGQDRQRPGGPEPPPSDVRSVRGATPRRPTGRPTQGDDHG